MFVDRFCCIYCLFLAAIWSPAGKEAIPWLFYVCFFLLFLSICLTSAEVWYLFVSIPDFRLLLYFYSIAIILMGKRGLVALLDLSSWRLVMVERLFLAVPRGCLRFVIVVFPDHTH